MLVLLSLAAQSGRCDSREYFEISNINGLLLALRSDNLCVLKDEGASLKEIPLLPYRKGVIYTSFCVEESSKESFNVYLAVIGEGGKSEIQRVELACDASSVKILKVEKLASVKYPVVDIKCYKGRLIMAVLTKGVVVASLSKENVANAYRKNNEINVEWFTGLKVDEFWPELKYPVRIEVGEKILVVGKNKEGLLIVTNPFTKQEGREEKNTANSDLVSANLTDCIVWNGSIWVSHAFGVSSFDGYRWFNYMIYAKNSKKPVQISRLKVLDGELFAASRDGVFHFKEAKWKLIVGESDLSGSVVLDFVKSKEGLLLATTSGIKRIELRR